MWQITDQTEATNFMVEVLKCRNCAQHIVVYERQTFPSQNQADMIYKDLCESHSLLQERTQYFMQGDQCFGHLPVIRRLPDENECGVMK